MKVKLALGRLHILDVATWLVCILLLSLIVRVNTLTFNIEKRLAIKKSQLLELDTVICILRDNLALMPDSSRIVSLHDLDLNDVAGEDASPETNTGNENPGVFISHSSIAKEGNKVDTQKVLTNNSADPANHESGDTSRTNEPDKPTKLSNPLRFTYTSSTDTILSKMFSVGSRNLVINIGQKQGKYFFYDTYLSMEIINKEMRRGGIFIRQFEAMGGSLEGNKVHVRFKEKPIHAIIAAEMNPVSGYLREIHFIGRLNIAESVSIIGYLQWEEILPNQTFSEPLIVKTHLSSY